MEEKRKIWLTKGTEVEQQHTKKKQGTQQNYTSGKTNNDCKK